VRISDVVIESFSPRVMRDWLLDYEHLKDVKDDLIMMSLPAVGVSGPWTHYVGYASTTEAISGMPALCGYEDGPRLQAPFVADPIGGLNGAAAISFALLHRESTGEGQFIEVAQYEGMVPFLGAALMETVLNGDVPARSPSGDTSFAPNGCYPCRGDDQWVVVCAPTEEEFVRLCEVIERPDLGGDDTLRRPADRAARRDFVDAAVAAWTSVRSPREAMKSLQDAGILAGAVNTAADVLDDPHIVSRESYIEIDREVVGSHPYPNVTTKLSETPGSVARPAPLFAEHNELVFGEMLGRTTDELLALRREGVIADEPVI
jgi:crotonobetainyl-CoA:carnitine CoA-transferase CaiB-like acyl-CoA transferase